MPEAEFIEAGDLIDEVRMIKSDEELGWVRKSAALTDTALEVFRNLVRPGRSESDVFVEVDHVMKRGGAENTYFMMSADPRPLAKFLDLATDTYEQGDIVLFNAEVSGPGGYYTQLERTFCLGQPTKEAEAAYDVCLQAENAACSLLRPGVKAKEVYRAIVSTIEGTGHKMGLHPGHSQGLDIFERPILKMKEEAPTNSGDDHRSPSTRSFAFGRRRLDRRHIPRNGRRSRPATTECESAGCYWLVRKGLASSFAVNERLESGGIDSE